jgi:hypothetical protein
MKKILIVAALLALAGCNSSLFGLNPNVASPSSVVVAINAFDAAEATAANYLLLPDCSKVTTKVCRSATISTSIVKAVKSGRVARDALQADLTANTTAPVTTIQVLTTAVATLQSLNAQ